MGRLHASSPHGPWLFAPDATCLHERLDPGGRRLAGAH